MPATLAFGNQNDKCGLWLVFKNTSRCYLVGRTYNGLDVLSSEAARGCRGVPNMSSRRALGCNSWGCSAKGRASYRGVAKGSGGGQPTHRVDSDLWKNLCRWPLVEVTTGGCCCEEEAVAGDCCGGGCEAVLWLVSSSSSSSIGWGCCCEDEGSAKGTFKSSPSFSFSSANKASCYKTQGTISRTVQRINRKAGWEQV
jgi:hypothetical protein